ncbi:MAG: serine hydrolase [Clostridia bacterium]|nr:serine hydrolase [Clostridia bacterium]
MNRKRRKIGAGKNAALILFAAAVLLGAVIFAAADIRSESAKLPETEERIARLEERLGGLALRAEEITIEKKQAESDLAERRLKIGSLETLIAQLEENEADGQSADRLESRLSEARRLADELRGEVDALAEKSAFCDQRLEAIESESGSVRAELTRLEARAAAAGTRRQTRDTALSPLSSPMTPEAVEPILPPQAEELSPAGAPDVSVPVWEEKEDEFTPEITTMGADPVVDASLSAPSPEDETVTPEEPLPPPADADEPKPKNPVVTAAVPEEEEEEEDDGDATDPEKNLLRYMKKGAPLRWVWKDEDSDELVQTYPNLAYFYLNLEDGDTVSYHADRKFYAASLVKVPYLYSVLLEIEAFEAGEPERDEDGRIIYQPGEEKYDLDEIWFYDPETMFVEGSGDIQKKDKGFLLTVRQLFEYALLYSDNIAFAQLCDRFGFRSYYSLADQLGIEGVREDFMMLSARDCAKYLAQLYRYFETGSPWAEWMRSLMTESKLGALIASHYPEGTVAHKYGWDQDAFHDMAIVFDEHPYLIVVMTDYADGGAAAFTYFAEVVNLTKIIHATDAGIKTGD